MTVLNFIEILWTVFQKHVIFIERSGEKVRVHFFSNPKNQQRKLVLILFRDGKQYSKNTIFPPNHLPLNSSCISKIGTFWHFSSMTSANRIVLLRELRAKNTASSCWHSYRIDASNRSQVSVMQSRVLNSGETINYWTHDSIIVKPKTINYCAIVSPEFFHWILSSPEIIDFVSLLVSHLTSSLYIPKRPVWAQEHHGLEIGWQQFLFQNR